MPERLILSRFKSSTFPLPSGAARCSATLLGAILAPRLHLNPGPLTIALAAGIFLLSLARHRLT